MKELSIEEKARAYDEAIKRAKTKLTNEIVEDIFQELKDSQDEKIRKALIQNLKERFGTKGNMGEGLDMPNVLTWLEKQGEKELVTCPICGWEIEKQTDHTKFINSIQIGVHVTRNKDGMLVNLSQLDRIAKKEENSAEWSEEDKKYYDGIIKSLSYLYNSTKDEDIKQNLQLKIIWLKSIKNRVLQQPKQEWSEEDERMKNKLVDFMLSGIDISKAPYGCVAWLKSLRPQNRWKLSDEQIRELSIVAEKDGTCLTGLYEQLKKLREK